MTPTIHKIRTGAGAIVQLPCLPDLTRAKGLFASASELSNVSEGADAIFGGVSHITIRKTYPRRRLVLAEAEVNPAVRWLRRKLGSAQGLTLE